VLQLYVIKTILESLAFTKLVKIVLSKVPDQISDSVI
jgi:hypothetical protein